MSYSTIYFIGLTVVFAIYYLALMYLDMKAKKKKRAMLRPSMSQSQHLTLHLPRLKRLMTAMLSKTGRMALTVQMLLLAVRIRGMPLMATRLIMS